MSTRWEYASVDMQGNRGNHVYFTHNQGANIVAEAKDSFGPGLKAQNSNAAYLDLNFSHLAPSSVLHFLGERGWEMCGVRQYPEGGGEYVLKRAITT